MMDLDAGLRRHDRISHRLNRGISTIPDNDMKNQESRFLAESILSLPKGSK
jgi:hypothetical protein